MHRADELFAHLLEQQIIVRNQSKVQRCEGGFRITVGTAEENQRLLGALTTISEPVGT